MTTGFFWDERCFWHGGGNYAQYLPVGGLVQPMAAGGLPESPETKRRLKNMMQVTGLWDELATQSAPEATREQLLRVHPTSFLDEFKRISDSGGGEIGIRTPFGPGGFEIASLSAGLATAALAQVLDGTLSNAYALSRPPGHHCLPERPNGFCLLANIAIAIEDAFAKGKAKRIAVLDWDVHHGNGTEAIFYDRDDVLTISIHQDRNYPQDTGFFDDRGRGKGEGFNLNIPLPAGTGHKGYLEAFDRLVAPALRAYAPDAIVVACGFDAALMDPLARMMATAETFRAMTERTMDLADDLCDGKVVLVHEGGYSEFYVPFCGHATIQQLARSTTEAVDPVAENFMIRQPDARFDAYFSGIIDDMVAALD
ncbi:class II histone deacetylase [Oceaniglobus indicus]|uniref:class II histone deacetylase n=1 Tax=Oceaniglobus indicus TaxID=2047749 RepID=UPI000C195813|nr:class II histone deacetylase [Oceaniglobus indicus]